MQDTIKISVIVPVFNGEKYLGKCLDSILAQTFEEFELVCVDDGSADSTPQILADYAGKDSRIQVIRQENRGCSKARNAGMEAAAGKYLVFWDADDWFYPEALEKMYLQCETDDADLCVCDGNTYMEGTEKETPSSVYLKTAYLPEKRPFSRNDIPEHILDFTSATVWNKMYRKAFLEENGLSFQDFVIGEDSNFVVKALCLAERITTVNERLICYRSGQNLSLSWKWSEGRTPIEAFVEAAEYLKERGILPERSFANKAWSSMLAVLRKAASVWKVFSEAAETLKGGALEKMCVVEREEGYYYEQWKADCLHHLLNDSTEDFLCYYLRITFQRLSQAAGQYRQTASKLSDSREESAGLKEKIGVLKEQRAELGEKLKETSSQNSALEKENTKLSTQLENATGKITRLTEKNDELRGIRKELNSSLQASKKQVEKLNSKTEELREIREDLADKLKNSEKHNEKLVEKVQILRDQKTEKADQLKEKNELLARSREKNKVLREQNATLREQNSGLRSRNESLKEQNRNIKNSAAYKIGRVLTWLPRKIKSLFRKK